MKYVKTDTKMTDNGEIWHDWKNAKASLAKIAY